MEAVSTGPWSIQVTWDMPSNPNGIITGYKLTVTHSNGTVYIVQVSSGTSYERTNLDPNTLYTVTVAAVTGGGDGESASTSATTDSLRKLASLHVLLVVIFMITFKYLYSQHGCEY